MMPYSVEIHSMTSKNTVETRRLGADSLESAEVLMDSCKTLAGVTRLVLLKNRENGRPEKLAVWTDNIAS